MNCKQDQQIIHRYLDGDLENEEELIFRKHIKQCESCSQNLMELEKSIALIRSLPSVQTSSGFTENVLSRLPKQRRNVIRNWIKSHPLLIAASLFVLFMLGSSLTTWMDGDNQIQILSHHNSYSLVIENGKVYVPEDKVIDGDLIVKHGDVQVDGKVNGDVIVIDGKVLLASTAIITGETDEINQLLGWIWYKIKSLGKGVVSP